MFSLLLEETKNICTSAMPRKKVVATAWVLGLRKKMIEEWLGIARIAEDEDIWINRLSNIEMIGKIGKCLFCCSNNVTIVDD